MFKKFIRNDETKKINKLLLNFDLFKNVQLKNLIKNILIIL